MAVDCLKKKEKKKRMMMKKEETEEKKRDGIGRVGLFPEIVSNHLWKL